MNKTAVFSAPKLAKFIRGLIAAGSFPVLQKTANKTPITKDSSPSQSPLGCRPISITPMIYKANKFIDSIKVLSNTQFGFRKGLGTTDAHFVADT